MAFTHFQFLTIRMKTNPSPATRRPASRFANRMKQQFALPMALGLVIMALGCAGDQHERSTGEFVDDHATSSRVQEALTSDAAYKFTEVKVTTYQGVVQLSGFVENGEQKDRATEIAKKTKGVKSVKNDIVSK